MGLGFDLLGSAAGVGAGAGAGAAAGVCTSILIGVIETAIRSRVRLTFFDAAAEEEADAGAADGLCFDGLLHSSSIACSTEQQYQARTYGASSLDELLSSEPSSSSSSSPAAAAPAAA